MININRNSEIINIIFIDISKSTYNWYNYNENMIGVLEKFSERIKNISIKYNAILLLPVGDGFKIVTNTIEDALLLSINVQKELKNDPIKIGKDSLKVKIGICQGPAYENTITIQNTKLKDYVGNVVNTASRIESNVCTAGNICFSILSTHKIDLTQSLKNYFVSLNIFGTNTKNDNNVVTNIKKIKYCNNTALNGINALKVYCISNI